MTSTQQLIPVTPALIGNQTVQTVDGRTLHTFLEVETRFNDWIERRIDEYGFEADKDFYSFLSKTPQGGRPSTEYTLTLNMGKELAMVEKTPKGKQARQYFIDCERRLLEGMSNPDLDALIAKHINRLFGNKVMVDYDTLASLTRLQWAVQKLAEPLIPLALKLEQQCGKPLIQDQIAGLAALENLEKSGFTQGQVIPRQPISHGAYKKQPLAERLLDFITAEKSQGVRGSDLSSGCRAYRNATDQEREAVLNLLLDQGVISQVQPPSKPGARRKALIYVAQPFVREVA